MTDKIQVRVNGGYLIATKSTDPDYPGIDVEYIADTDNGNDASKPRVLVEFPKYDTLRALIWNNPNNEDYSEEVTLL